MTGVQKEINMIKIDSSELNNSKILENSEKDIREAVKLDLAK